MAKRVITFLLVISMLAPSALTARAAKGEDVEDVVVSAASKSTSDVGVTNAVQEEIGTVTESENKFDAEAHDAKAAYKMNPTPTSRVNLLRMESEYIEFYVAEEDHENSGRFTIGNTEGNPNDSQDDDAILLFGHGDPWSSYTTIRINGTNYIFEAHETSYNEESKEVISVMMIEQIVVTQKLKIVENSITQLMDTVQISYAVQNNSNSSQDVGIRIMMDTMLGSNDGAPFKVPTLGNVTYECELVGNVIPATWQATDSLTNPSVFSMGTLYKTGERKPDKIQFAAWGEIYYSSSAWDYSINSSRSVTGDSAVAVYWNPQVVAAGGSIGVATYYGVGYTSNYAEESVDEVPADGFSIMVTNENSSPVSGATVQALNVSGTPEVVTNENGIAVFHRLPMGTDNTRTVMLAVSKDNYVSTTVSREVARGGSAAVSIYPDDGTIRVVSATGTIDGTSLDLLSKNKYFKSNPSSVEEGEDGSNVKDFVIQVEAFSSEKIAKYQLIQSGQVVAESASSTITIPVLTGTPSNPDKFGSDWRITKLSAGKKVYLRLVDEDGNTSERISLGIVVSEPDLYGFTDTKGSLNLGDKLKITVPSGVPLLGDTEIELGWNGLPFEFEIFEDGKVKFAINVDLADYKKATIVNGAPITDWDSISDKYSEALEEILSRKSFSKDKLPFKAGLFAVDSSVMGYGEGYVDEYGNLHANVGIIVTVTESYSYTWTYFLGYVPVYVSLGETVSLSGSGELNILASNGGISISGAVGEINPKLTFNADGGVGANNVLHIGVSGRLAISWLNRWTDNYNKVSATGSMHIVAKAFLFQAEKKILEGTWVIYDSYGARSLSGADYEMLDLYDSSSYTPIERCYLSAPEIRSYDSQEEGVVRAYVYPDASPTLVQIGDAAYLFWLEDIASRAANDRTALVYAKSNDLVTWSDPLQIIPETEQSTADYAYSVCVDGTDVHIAISKANYRFDEQEVSIDDLASSAEIYYARLDTLTDTVDNVVRLTENEYSDTLPSVTVNNGEILVAYAENRMEGGLFGQDNTYRACCTVIGGETTDFEVDGLIADLSAGQLNGSSTVSYIVDTDRDFYTTEDAALWLIFDGSAAQVENSGTGIASLNYAGMGSLDVLLWHAEEGLCCLSEANGSTEVLLSAENGCPVGKAFVAINDGDGNLMLVWERMADDEESNHTIFNAVDWDSSGWSDSYVLYMTDSELTGVLSGYSDGQAVNIAYLETWTEYDDATYSSLRVDAIGLESDAQLVNVVYAQDDVTPGEILPMTLVVRNNGAARIDTIRVTADSEVIYTIENAALERGDTKEYTVEAYSVDADLSDAQTVHIGIDVDTDRNDYDNSRDISIGYVDLQVTCSHILVNQEDWLNIVVSNLKSIPAGTVLRVFADEENGALLYERRTSSLAYGNSESILLNLNKVDPAGSIDLFYITVEAADNEIVLFNNYTSIYMANTREKTYPLTISAGVGGALTGPAGGAYPEGEIVEIGAAPSKGYVFSHWISSDGGTFGDMYAAETTFVMPENNVQVTAVFEELVHEHIFTQYHSNNDATCTQDGTKTAECDLCRTTNTIPEEGTMIDHSFQYGYCIMCGMDYALYVHEVERVETESSLYPESEHNYSDNLDDIQIFTSEGAYALELTFSNETETEDSYDYIYLYDDEDNLLFRFSGVEAMGLTVTIPGDTVKIQLVTDSSVTYYGYSFTSIVACYIEHSYGEYISNNDATCEQDGTKSAECTLCHKVDTVVDEGTMIDHSFQYGYCIMCGMDYVLYVHEAEWVEVDRSLYPESEHNYSDNLDDIQVFTYAGAYALELTFSNETETENSYDYIYLYDDEDNLLFRFSGVEAMGLTVTIPGDTVKICLDTDGSVTYYGYSFTSITAYYIEHSYTEYVSNGDATCEQDGTKTAECTVCGCTHTVADEGSRKSHIFEDGLCTLCGMDYRWHILSTHTLETVTADPFLYPESNHTYDNKLNDLQTFTYEGAYALELTFSSLTETEFSCDYIYLYDDTDNLLYTFTGVEATGRKVTVLGDTVKIRLVSDGSITYYGYSFDAIAAISIKHPCENGICTACGEDTVVTSLEGNALSVSGELTVGTQIVVACYNGEQFVGVKTLFWQGTSLTEEIPEGETVKLFFVDEDWLPLRTPVCAK